MKKRAKEFNKGLLMFEIYVEFSNERIANEQIISFIN